MRRRRRLIAVLIVLLLSIIAASFVLERMDRKGRRFFETGKQISASLDNLASAVRKGDLSSIARFYSSTYRGGSLGLDQLFEVGEEHDGIVSQTAVPPELSFDRQAALDEWQKYLASFEGVEEAALHLDHLEKWDTSGPLIATIRFELIGTPRGRPRPAIDRVRFRMSFDLTAAGIMVREAYLIEGARLYAEKAQFSNVGPTAGINFKNQFYPRFLTERLRFAMIRYGPAGITAADYDNDGLYDLFIPDGVESHLFRNRGDGTFEDVTTKAGLAGLDGVSVALFADYDNDGHKDFFVSRTFNPNQLFHNNGDGTFSDVTAKSGIGSDCCTTVASWADYDDDGFLDLYVGRYIDPRKDIPTTVYARNGEPNQLYHNNGDGTFTNVTARAGVGEKGLCLGTVWGDYDDDGYPDLYIVNDFGRNTLYHNNRNGTFTDVTVRGNTLAYGAGMSASFADYDNDGRLDIYVTNIRSEHAWFAEWPTVFRYMFNSWKQGVWITDMPLYWEMFRQSGFGFVDIFQQMASGNTLLRNKGDGTFEDVTWKANANPIGWFWGASFADFDNDGWQDIYAADGWVYSDRGTEIELDFLNNVVSRQKDYKTGMFFDPNYFGHTSWHGWERNRHLRNNGDGTFTEIGTAAGTDLITNSRGVAVADFWNRGHLDIAIAASTDRHALLKNNIDNRNSWLAVELIGTQSNRDAVGARVTIEAAGKRQMREVVLGDGYGSQNTLRQYFGLGANTKVDNLIVRWPRSGITQTFRDVGANHIVRITEGRSELEFKQ